MRTVPYTWFEIAIAVAGVMALAFAWGFRGRTGLMRSIFKIRLTDSEKYTLREIAGIVGVGLLILCAWVLAVGLSPQ